ncbi:DoxX family protein [Candidatus Pacearchaeota archaeon]|nr:DoxX family protein [Candidatus Pacearchaeota archaeon]
MENKMQTLKKLNWILLGLTMLVSGLLKLFMLKPAAVVGMLAGLGFPAPTFFAWILMLSEVVFGVAILARWNLKYTTIPPAIILVVAAFTVYWANWTNMLVHLTLASNYLLLGMMGKKA